jgi:hypothetical protein
MEGMKMSRMMMPTSGRNLRMLLLLLFRQYRPSHGSGSTPALVKAPRNEDR